ncbi:MAG: hypothetical protein PHD72_01265 [Patescibacteria group bacterium]|nr:hypothetical protein [Patescibacteria group bacterium]
MEKFNSSKHGHLTKDLPLSFLSLPVYLDFCAHILERNGEPIIVRQDALYEHEFPSIFLPKNPQNWQRASMAMITKHDIEKIKAHSIEVGIETPTETEFFYNTNDFVNPRGKLKERINQFENNYDFVLKNTYSKDALATFFKTWEGQKECANDWFEKESADFFFYCLENLEKYGIAQVYVEVENKLVGFAWGVKHLGNNWAGLHMKVDYNYKGLSRFIHHERAKIFSGYDMFTLGTGCEDPGLIQFKKELKPVKEQEYFYVFTRGIITS